MNEKGGLTVAISPSKASIWIPILITVLVIAIIGLLIWRFLRRRRRLKWIDDQLGAVQGFGAKTVVDSQPQPVVVEVEKEVVKVRCSYCGTLNTSHEKACSNCGAVL